MRLLVLGASGMLGNAMIRVLAEHGEHEVYGTVRSADVAGVDPRGMAAGLFTGIDVGNEDSLTSVFGRLHPDVVINCVGLIKQVAGAEDPLLAIPLNALLPHRLSRLCDTAGARLIHISTDCVFSGQKGGYQEADFADARDLYGMSKYLGEVHAPHAITLRTSIIGHALHGADGLIDWFLAQQQQCVGFAQAIFSGLPTVVLARLVRDVILPDSDLHGLYHVAADPISKYDLLQLVRRVYGKTIEIAPDDRLVLDRSLNAENFRAATGYTSPSWPELVEIMYLDYLQSKNQDHV